MYTLKYAFKKTNTVGDHYLEDNGSKERCFRVNKATKLSPELPTNKGNISIGATIERLRIYVNKCLINIIYVIILILKIYSSI